MYSTGKYSHYFVITLKGKKERKEGGREGGKKEREKERVKERKKERMNHYYQTHGSPGGVTWRVPPLTHKSTDACLWGGERHPLRL